MLPTISCSQSFYDLEMEKVLNIKKNDKVKPVFDGYIEPSIEDAVKSSLTIDGADINKNKVRDDIEIWINRKADNPILRKLMKRYTVLKHDQINIIKPYKVQEFLDDDKLKTKREELNEISKIKDPIMGCFAFKGLSDKYANLFYRDLHTMIFNTEARLDLSVKLDFMLIRRGRINASEESCAKVLK